MKSVKAWLLDCGEIFRVAVGEHELVEVLQDAPVNYVPCGLKHFRNVIVWRGRILPALNIGGFAAPPGETVSRKAVVVAFQCAPKERLQYGAILLDEYPLGIQVDDSMTRPIDFDCNPLSTSVNSCFEWEEGVVLVVDPARLFGAEPSSAGLVRGERTVACVIEGSSVNLSPALSI